MFHLVHPGFGTAAGAGLGPVSLRSCVLRVHHVSPSEQASSRCHPAASGRSRRGSYSGSYDVAALARRAQARGLASYLEERRPEPHYGGGSSFVEGGHELLPRPQ